MNTEMEEVVRIEELEVKDNNKTKIILKHKR